jgi:hypothetical protein
MSQKMIATQDRLEMPARRIDLWELCFKHKFCDLYTFGLIFDPLAGL